MPTTFNVISLGNFSSIDATEGDMVAENAGNLVGTTFGGPGNALSNNTQTFSQGTSGFGGGNTTAYDMDNSSSNDTFSIDGGPDQVFDGTAVYSATITYLDGTTATVSAVVFQDTAGNTYLAPEFSDNADQAAYEAAPIQSLELTSLLGNNYSGMTGSREDNAFLACFVKGTKIRTTRGDEKVEDLRPGDLVETLDNGVQPIRWLARSDCLGFGRQSPIRIKAGALGQNLPTRDLYVSRQHRFFIRSKIAKRICGVREVLVPAIKLLGLPGVSIGSDFPIVSYFHILFERHEVIFAENAFTESLLLGPLAVEGLCLSTATNDGRPKLVPTSAPMTAARHVPRGKAIRDLIRRHKANAQPLVQSEVGIGNLYRRSKRLLA